MKRSTKIILAMAGITALTALGAWFGGLTGPSGSGRIALRGTVIEAGKPGGSFKIFCADGRHTVVPDKNCKLLRIRQVGLDQVPADRYAEIKGIVDTTQTSIAPRSITLYPAGETHEEILTTYRAVGNLVKRGTSLALTINGKEIAVRDSQTISFVVQDSPDPSDPALDSIVEVRGRPGWWSIKADDIIIHRIGPDFPDTPGLPRVLLLGGPMGGRSLGAVRKSLTGIANVHQAGRGWENTDSVLENIDDLLGPHYMKRKHWDVIYFNFGIGDLRLVTGKNRTPLDKYSRNLQTLLDRLEATGAKLVWATIPPLRQNRPQPDLRAEDIKKYNAAAMTVMAKNKIEINDLDALVSAKLQGQANAPSRQKIILDELTAAVKHALGK